MRAEISSSPISLIRGRMEMGQHFHSDWAESKIGATLRFEGA